MSNNKKVIIFAVILLAIAGAVLYFYFNGSAFQLIKEAETLYAQGDIRGAHEKAQEAMEKDSFNRRAISLKSELFFLISNEDSMNQGKEALQKADAAVRSGDYINAHSLYHDAFKHFFDVSSMSEHYEEATKYIEEVVSKYNNIKKDIGDQYYTNAMRMYRNGEYSKAFEYLQQYPFQGRDNGMPDPLPTEIVRLKSDIGYTLGLQRYNEIKTGGGTPAKTYVNDAIYWFKQIDRMDSKYPEAQQFIQELQQMPSR